MTEKEIREGNLPVISYLYGEVDITELKDTLNKSPNLSKDELSVSNSRPGEKRINQKIGNIVSHQTELIKCYDAFMINKTIKPATISLIDANGYTISRDLIEKKREEIKKLLFLPKQLEETTTSSLTDSATEFVQNFELGRLKNIVPEDKMLKLFQNTELKNAALKFGFNLMSYNSQGIPIAIIIKATQGSLDTLFNFSTIEKAIIKSRIAENMCYVYRVYNFKPELKIGSIDIKDATEIEF